jgi:hypothetical protein
MPRCNECGADVAEHELDLSYRLPDVVHGLPKATRDKRAVYTSALCVLDAERFFIRGVLNLRVARSERPSFGWGLWVEVSEAGFERHCQMRRADQNCDPPVEGVLANDPPGYGRLGHQRVTIVFVGGGVCPVLVLKPSRTRLYREQRDGISEEALHRYLVLHGFVA